MEEFDATLAGEATLRAYPGEEAPGLRDTDGPGIVAALSTLLPDVDRALLTDEYGAWLGANFREGLRTGVDGWLDDNLAFARPWGFGLASMTVPTFIWQSDQDLMVPFAHGRWLAAHIPGVTAHLEAGEGHLSIGVGALDRMFAELAATL